MADEISVQPASSEAARAEIERTRARMSETIDEIEENLLRTREDLRKKFDLLGRVREKPLQSAGVVLCAGLILGLLTGGGRRSKAIPDGDSRAEHWESRARRLLAIARTQEEELDELRSLLNEVAEAMEDGWSEAEADDEADLLDDVDEPSWLADMKDVVAERAEDFVASSVATLLDAFKRAGKRR